MNVDGGLGPRASCRGQSGHAGFWVAAPVQISTEGAGNRRRECAT